MDDKINDRNMRKNQTTSTDILEQTKDPEYEQAFQKKHQRLSFMSSGLFAFSGAMFIGILGALCSQVLESFKQKKSLIKITPDNPEPLLRNRGYIIAASAMTSIGGIAMYLSNKLETRKTVYEDRRLAHLIDTKTGGISRQKTPPIVDEEIPESIKRADGKSWVEASRASPTAQHSIH